MHLVVSRGSGAAGRLGGGPQHAAEAGLGARIVLMWAQGAGVTAIIRATGKTKKTAYRCYLAGGEGDER